MDDSDEARKFAEGYWHSVAEPVVKKVVVDGLVAGMAQLLAQQAEIARWLNSMPQLGLPPIGAAPIAVTTQEGSVATAEEKPRVLMAAPAAASPVGPAELSPGEAPPRVNRANAPLRGLSAVAYNIMASSDAPIASQDFLRRMRERVGGPRTDAQTNTLLATIRRLRKAGYLDFDGTDYRIGQRSPGQL